jgi:methyl-coenzyme M reductase beta subunit
VIAAGCAVDAGTQMFSPEATSSLVRDVFGDIPEFKAPFKAVGKEAKKIKDEVA